MLNKERPDEISVSSGPVTYDTPEIISRQGGSLLSIIPDELYYASIKADKIYRVHRQVNGIEIANQYVDAEGPSAEDLARFGLDADESLFGSTWSALVKSASQSKTLRVAAALGALFVGAKAFLENSHLAEASVTGNHSLDPLSHSNFDNEMVSANTPTLIDGNGSINSKHVLLIPWNGAPAGELLDVAKDFRAIYPFSAFDMSFYSKNPTRDLTKAVNCAPEKCDWTEVNAETDEANAIVPIDYTMMVVRADGLYGGGSSVIPSCNEPPTNHNPAKIIRPIPSLIPKDYDGFKIDLAHEHGHQYCLDHEGGDIMVNQANVFNEAHAQFLLAQHQFEPFSIRRNSFPLLSGNNLTGGAPGGIIQLEKMGLSLDPPIPGGTTGVKFLLQQEDGEEITMIYGSTDIFDKMRKGTFRVEELSKYILQPDQLVNVKVWVTNESLDWNSPNWENHLVRPNLRVPGIPWARTYRTPKVDSATISSSSLGNGDFTIDNTPTLQWKDTNPGTFYYEVQLSGDPSFNMDPGTAVSFVYWNLIHGGVAKPENSWTVPDNAALTQGKYYWRIRPRIQGSGTPVGWSQPWAFEVKPAA